MRFIAVQSFSLQLKNTSMFGVNIDKMGISIKICILWVENGPIRHLLFKVILNPARPSVWDLCRS